ncbi:hypothetical protein J6590_049214 [Homalodisca vitripennis]|nr:hypothetical protein J6590_049214 [Homalodisca vitripennis]
MVHVCLYSCHLGPLPIDTKIALSATKTGERPNTVPCLSRNWVTFCPLELRMGATTFKMFTVLFSLQGLSQATRDWGARSCRYRQSPLDPCREVTDSSHHDLYAPITVAQHNRPKDGFGLLLDLRQRAQFQFLEDTVVYICKLTLDADLWQCARGGTQTSLATKAAP